MQTTLFFKCTQEFGTPVIHIQFDYFCIIYTSTYVVFVVLWRHGLKSHISDSTNIISTSTYNLGLSYYLLSSGYLSNRYWSYGFNNIVGRLVYMIIGQNRQLDVNQGLQFFAIYILISICFVDKTIYVKTYMLYIYDNIHVQIHLLLMTMFMSKCSTLVLWNCIYVQINIY